MTIFAPATCKQFDTLGFARHLELQGAVIGHPTNVYEVIRYKVKGVTHIVYMKQSGVLTYTGESEAHYVNFLTNREELKAIRTRKVRANGAPKHSTKRIRDALRERDGICCWYCGCFVDDEGTIEHLIPRSDGGLNVMSNLVLAHQTCNQRAGALHLSGKIELRTSMRAAQAEMPPWEMAA